MRQTLKPEIKGHESLKEGNYVKKNNFFDNLRSCHARYDCFSVFGYRGNSVGKVFFDDIFWIFGISLFGLDVVSLGERRSAEASAERK